MPATHLLGGRRVEARQLTRQTGPAVWEWADSKPYYSSPQGPQTATGIYPQLVVTGLTIWAKSGRIKAEFGDWVIKGPRRSFWPVKADVFARDYTLIAKQET